jgi:hypothetical protein
MKYPASRLTPFLPSFPQTSPATPFLFARNLSVIAGQSSVSLFSSSYELPLKTTLHRRSLFSYNYELLFSQLLSFQNHLRCPMLFPIFPALPVSRPANSAERMAARSVEAQVRHSSLATRHFDVLAQA